MIFSCRCRFLKWLQHKRHLWRWLALGTACVLLFQLFLHTEWSLVHRTQININRVGEENKLQRKGYLVDKSHMMQLPGEAQHYPVLPVSSHKEEWMDKRLNQSSAVEAKWTSLSLHTFSHTPTVPTRDKMVKSKNPYVLSVAPEEKHSVLDTKIVIISPKQLTVPEGLYSHMSCTSPHIFSGTSSAAPYMTFELPPMLLHDRQTVRLLLRPGN